MRYKLCKFCENRARCDDDDDADNDDDDGDCAVGYTGAICIGVAALLIILACCGCLIRMCWKRRKDKQFKKGVKGAVDMKSVQMLTSAMKEKVCADFIPTDYILRES